MQAVIAKELREHAKWLPLGLGAVSIAAWLVSGSILSGPLQEPWSELNSFVGLVAALFAVLLGGLQGVVDFGVSGGDFLFQRGLSRRQIVGGKLWAGALIYTVATGVPLIAWAAWAAQTSINFTPVSWTLVGPALLMAAYSFLLYPATLYCMGRPGRWYGAKFLPLLPAAGVALLGFNTLYESPLTVAVAVLVGAATLTCYIVGLIGWRTIHVPVMLVSVVIVSMIGYALVEAQLRGSPLQWVGQETGVDAEGRVWEYHYRTRRTDKSLDYGRVYVAARQLGGGEQSSDPRTIPADFEPQGFTALTGLRAPETVWRKFSFAGGTLGSAIYDNEGLVYDYDWSQQPPLRATFTPEGGKPGWQTQGPRFTGNAPNLGYLITSSATPTTSVQGSPSIWADSQGIYQVDVLAGSVTPILSGPLDAAASYRSSKTSPPELFVRQGNVIRHYRWTSQDSNQPIFETTGYLPCFVSKLPPVKLELIAELPPLPDWAIEQAWVAVTSQGTYTIMGHFIDRVRIGSWSLASPATWQYSEDRLSLSPIQPSGLRTVVLAIIASAFAIPFLVIGIFVSWQQGHSAAHMITTVGHGSPQSLLLPIVLAASVVLSLVAVELLARRRSLPSRDRWLWRLATLFFGLAVPFTMLTLYERIAQVVCAKCDQRRSVRLRKCEHCGAAWPQVPTSGIELLERPVNQQASSLSEVAST